MAFKRTKFTGFTAFLKSTAQSPNSESSCVAENFILEERLTEQREDSYESHQPSIQDWNTWKSGHESYLENKIHINPGVPETFTGLNHINLFPSIDPEQSLVRLENVSRLTRYHGGTLDEMMRDIQEFIENRNTPKNNNILSAILHHWNRVRDHRPLFAGFWGEVKDIFFDADGNKINDKYWADRLRDRFGLGHLIPTNGEPIPVFMFMYPVKDVPTLDDPHDNKKIAIPTVLDGRLAPFFCPTPKNGWKEGQALDLSDSGKNPYSINSEILHSRIEYIPDYLFKVGWITKQPGKTLEKARKIHLDLMLGKFETKLPNWPIN